MLHVASMDAHRSTHDLVTDVSLCGDAVILQVFSLLATAITMNLRAPGRLWAERYHGELSPLHVYALGLYG